MSRKRKPPKVDAVAVAGHRRSDDSLVPPPAQRWVRWIAPLLVALLTLVAFLPTLQNQFVNWDDDHNFLDNPHYRGLGWTHLHWMWTTFHMGHYIPLTWMTFGVDYVLWGMNPVGYHLTGLLLHATNAVVFYFLVLRMLTLALPGLSERGRALAGAAGFAALVFALHPLRVESVAWATERRDVLSALFYLLTILVYLRACEREGHGRWSYWLSVVLFGCALLSKSMAVSLPVVLLILDIYPLRRLGGPTGWWSEPARRVYVEKIPFVVLAAAVSAIAFKALFTAFATPSLAQFNAPSRLAVSAYGLSFYLWKMVVPSTLSPLYMLPATLNPWAMPFVLSYALVLAITALALALRRRVPGLLAVWSAYAVVLLPVLGIFQNGAQIAADRYTYLAGLGWAILASGGLLSGWRALRRSTTGAPTTLSLVGIAPCIVIALGVLTWNQVQVWHDSERLWAHAVTIDPDSPIAHTNLGSELYRQGRSAEGIEHFKQALRITRHAEAYISLGVALNEQGKAAEAIEHFQQALRIKPAFAPEVHNNWGLALIQQSKPAEAIEHFQQALRVNPDFAEAHNNWGLALARQTQLTEAIEHFQHALRIKPDLAEAHNNWGLALVQEDRLAKQVWHALQMLPPGVVKTELTLASQGHLAEAIEHFREALRIKPDYARAHSSWGFALLQQGKPAAAIEHFQLALLIEPGLAEAHANLSRALAQQGKLSPRNSRAIVPTMRP